MIYQYFQPEHRSQRVDTFPLYRVLFKKSGSVISAYMLTLCSQTVAAESATAAVEAYLLPQLQAFAIQQQWHSPRIEFHHHSIGSQPNDCIENFEVSGASNDLLNRQRLTLHCPSSNLRLTVVSQATLYIQALYASQSIERGSPVTSSNTQLAELEVGRNTREFLSHPAQLNGQQAKRRIRAKQLLSPSLLTNARTISRGERVRIVANHEGINASTVGEALEHGSVGDIIRVRNLSSEKTIDAQVIEAGTVSSLW